MKYENLQATASFKERGALIRMLALTAEERARGVIAMSAGNHAQAVAWHAQRLGIHATIVMPAPTPFVKIAATRSFGAEVVIDGETLADCQTIAEKTIAQTGAVLIHPYDDGHVIAGQGTIGLEILEDRPDLDTVIVPVGGGGLISGIAIAVKALKPETQGHRRGDRALSVHVGGAARRATRRSAARRWPRASPSRMSAG